MNADLDFEMWLTEVDQVVEDRVGMSVHDLPDCPFRDWYDDGMKAATAAGKAIKNAKF